LVSARPILNRWFKIEVCSNFSYIATMLAAPASTTKRRGARRKREVPQFVLSALAAGEIESANLMEWLAADMGMLARTVAGRIPSKRLSIALRRIADDMPGLGILGRLQLAGQAIAKTLRDFENPSFRALSEHPSDLVRQWACYAVNSQESKLSRIERFAWTLRFAADANMSVREAAWMAYRPHLQRELGPVLKLLEGASEHLDQNIRRFSVEVSRPRSVWGSHIHEFKQNPDRALSIVENVRSDESRYVQLAAGNWLNDASKTRPDWVVELCARWARDGRPFSHRIVKRGLRTLGGAERFIQMNSFGRRPQTDARSAA
jgi:3-methyladenine DNA glycosylase AlkC